MKKFFVLLAIVTLLLPSCQKINDRIDGLEGRIDQIEGTQIATINQQIEAINTTLPQLRETDTELKDYIKSLQTTATNLQEQITNTNDDIDELEDALDQAIADAEASNDALKAELVAQLNAAKADILAQLEATKTALEAELNQINTTIATLQTKDIELEGKIATLEEYVNTELQNTEDWATATFASLEQYNTIVEDIATIKTQIEALNTSLTNLEERLNTKIVTDIAAAVEGLLSELATKVTDITTAYTTAISTAKEEIAAAYTEAIATAITNLESSMKEWVNEQLTGYYTIAETEAAIERLKGHITSGDAAFQEIEMLSQRMEDVKTKITEAYQKAIETAILENNGVIDSKIASEVTTINGRIDQEVATINAKITEIESRLDNIEAQITELLTRIQSASYIPTYDDGKATIISNGTSSYVTLDFEISPKDAVVDLAKVWKSAVSLKAVYTQTRAVSFIDMPIVKFESDETTGVISITASGENLSPNFFMSSQSASARLAISDGNNTLTSEYIPMVAQVESYIIFKDSSVKNICLANWDFNNDGELSYDEAANVSSIDNMFNGWLYENLRGGWLVTVGNHNLVSFNELKYFTGIKTIPSTAFANNINMTEVELPLYLERINGKSSYTIEQYTQTASEIRITVALAPFRGTLISTITLPETIINIGEQPFYGADNLKTIYCRAQTPPTLNIGLGVDGCKIYVPRESVGAYKAANIWKQYADYIEGYDFENNVPVE